MGFLSRAWQVGVFLARFAAALGNLHELKSLSPPGCRRACWDRRSMRGCHTSLAEISLWHCGHATSTLRAGSERLRTVLWISTALPCRYAQALTVTFGHRLPKIFSHLNQARPVREIGLLSSLGGFMVRGFHGSRSRQADLAFNARTETVPSQGRPCSECPITHSVTHCAK